eukprot:PhM_4_TR6649/c0_g1_i1/m.61028
MTSTEDATRHTLRELKKSGALSGPTLDQKIAQELLSTPRESGRGGAASKNNNNNNNRNSDDYQQGNDAGASVALPGAAGGPKRLSVAVPTGGPVSGGGPSRSRRGSQMLATPLQSGATLLTPTAGYLGGTPLEMTTSELVQRLDENCDAFTKSLIENTKVARDIIHRSSLQLFLSTVKTKVPVCILHSLPKFTRHGTATTAGAQASAGVAMNNSASAHGRRPLPPLNSSSAMEASVVSGSGGQAQQPGYTGSAIAKALTSQGVEKSQTKDVPFDITLHESVVDDISSDIATIVEAEMRKCQSALIADIQRILTDVSGLKLRLEYLEETGLQMASEGRVMSDEVAEYADRVKELEEQLEDHTVQLRDKDTQMDVLRDQVKRRNAAIDQLRSTFRNEIIGYKAKEIALKEENDMLRAGGGSVGATAAGGGGTALGVPSPSGGGGLGGSSANYSQSVEEAEASSFEVTASMFGIGNDTATVDKLREQIRSLKVEHAKEKKLLVQEYKLKLDEKDNELYHLKTKVRNLEMELDKIRGKKASTLST